jgi:hypothetical protein
MNITTSLRPSPWIGLAAAALLTASCSTGAGAAPSDGGNGLPAGDAGACPPYQSDADLTTPVVSFGKDVIPIFEKTCGVGSTCHGGDPATDISQRGVFLGCAPDASATCLVTGDPAPQVYAGLIGPNADTPAEESCMPFVKPGNPTQSYLMRKMDSDLCGMTCCTQNNAAAGSVGAMGCGTVMPYLQAVLPPSTRDTVRRWIVQGAKNN